MKLCKDCRWSDGSQEFLQCVAPQNTVTEDRVIFPVQVTGEVVEHSTQSRRYSYCGTHRRHGWFWPWIDGTCGRQGRWFELREPQHSERKP